MNMNRAAMVTALLLAASAINPASAGDYGVKAGILTCNEASGWGFIFASSRNLKCEYSPSAHTGERYTGTIKTFGVDIGYLSSSVMIWAVFAPTSDVSPGALAGDYAGVTGSAALGVGVGANALVGGSERHTVLQPLSIEGQTGLNIAAGIAALNLKADR